MREDKPQPQTTRTALERAEDAIARADCYFDFGLNACATEIAVEINAAVAAERARLTDEQVQLVAKGVLSERERCARVLERLGRFHEADVIRRPEQYR